jgi:hypothetical protein
MLRFLALPQRFAVFPASQEALPPYLENVVEEIWQAERRRRGSKLFNGTLFSVDKLSETTVTGCFVEYRRFVAQVQRPGLFAELQVRPLAVTGVLQNADGIFFGLRNAEMAQQPSCWELIPAGGIDDSTLTDGRIEPQEQMLAELEEEVGIDRALVEPPRLVAFCEEPEHHVFDLVWELKTSLENKDITMAHGKLGVSEHVDVRCVCWKDLDEFLADGPRAVAAGVRELIAHIAPQEKRM